MGALWFSFSSARHCLLPVNALWHGMFQECGNVVITDPLAPAVHQIVL
jgi:hypothetical protein